MKYNPIEIEANWQKYWAEHKTFAASNSSAKPKYYVLDMFPYPSGAGLHVGHPLGYIASDIVARYKRHKGFNVLHPQGYDSFGLPAEQYAIQTGQHPDKTTKENIARYRQQLDRIGFSFDWDREVRTSNADYYKHTQWIFIQLFNSWYNKKTDKAEDISTLITIFEMAGNSTVQAVCDDNVEIFFPSDWKFYSEQEKQKILLQYRLTYLAETQANWCPELGTVLANDEIINGVSERGGHPVIRKKMTQWNMRISAYAERLLRGLETIDWSESIKESQRNWIGKSVGAMVTFKVKNQKSKVESVQQYIEVFTTRPDTIFGVTFMTLAPEHPLVQEITTDECRQSVNDYIEKTAKRSERERMADVKTISGVFTGAYAEHPFTKEPIPVWIGDYVLAGYGTGAVMAVPCGDERDYAFAKHFDISIKNIFENVDISEAAYGSKDHVIIANSDFLDGLDYKQATKKSIEELEKINQGSGKTNYRLRDAVFSRQRYWGEPFPVYYVNGLPQMIDAEHLPIKLPEVEKYLPTEDGQPPLGNSIKWAWNTVTNQVDFNEKIDNVTIFPLELNTMPGWAGSSWYWLRYMDAKNENEFASPEAIKYWESVDLYIGGSEHATGHLLYARFWNKFLKDKGFSPTEEPFKKLINQGMILGNSALIYEILFEGNLKIKDINFTNFDEDELFLDDGRIYISKNIVENSTKDYLNQIVEKYIIEGFCDAREIKLFSEANFEFSSFDIRKIHIDISYLKGITDNLDLDEFKKSYGHYSDAEFILESGLTLHISDKLEEEDQFITVREIEKMSKSKYNVVTPDDICIEYGADTLRLYEMFLGPLEQSKPWNTAGISGVFGFLKKLWRLYFETLSNSPEEGEQITFCVTNNEPSAASLKSLHKTIKKCTEDIENFSFNTSVSQFMICVNELQTQNCHERAILEPLAILISPYAPHIAEELWKQLGHSESISTIDFPIYDEQYLVESQKEYPVSFNGKMRFTIQLPLDLTPTQIEEIIMDDERTIKQLDGKAPKKVIIVPGKVINLVL